MRRRHRDSDVVVLVVIYSMNNHDDYEFLNVFENRTDISYLNSHAQDQEYTLRMSAQEFK